MRWKYRIIGSATLASRFQVLFLGFSDKRKSDYLAVRLRVRLRLKMILRHFFASGLGHPVPEVIRIRISGFEITANFKLTNKYYVSKYFFPVGNTKKINQFSTFHNVSGLIHYLQSKTGGSGSTSHDWTSNGILESEHQSIVWCPIWRSKAIKCFVFGSKPTWQTFSTQKVKTDHFEPIEIFGNIFCQNRNFAFVTESLWSLV